MLISYERGQRCVGVCTAAFTFKIDPWPHFQNRPLATLRVTERPTLWDWYCVCFRIKTLYIATSCAHPLRLPQTIHTHTPPARSPLAARLLLSLHCRPRRHPRNDISSSESDPHGSGRRTHSMTISTLSIWMYASCPIFANRREKSRRNLLSVVGLLQDTSSL